VRIALLVLIAVNWHLLSKIWCQNFRYAKMAPLARR
jgi:cbb3-type cytochrome oxidase subunit 3